VAVLAKVTHRDVAPEPVQRMRRVGDRQEPDGHERFAREIGWNTRRAGEVCTTGLQGQPWLVSSLLFSLFTSAIENGPGPISRFLRRRQASQFSLVQYDNELADPVLFTNDGNEDAITY
jgi:hypothetical protein